MTYVMAFFCCVNVCICLWGAVQNEQINAKKDQIFVSLILLW